jgi:hypothetical protein
MTASKTARCLEGHAPGVDCGERTTEQKTTKGLPALPTAIRRLLLQTQALER